MAAFLAVLAQSTTVVSALTIAVEMRDRVAAPGREVEVASVVEDSETGHTTVALATCTTDAIGICQAVLEPPLIMRFDSAQLLSLTIGGDRLVLAEEQWGSGGLHVVLGPVARVDRMRASENTRTTLPDWVSTVQGTWRTLLSDPFGLVFSAWFLIAAMAFAVLQSLRQRARRTA